MESVDMMLQPVRAFLTQVGAFVPRFAIALVVLVAGWVLAKVARFTISKGLRAVNFNVVTERAGLDGFLAQGGLRTDTVGLFGLIAYWLVILAALIIAFNGLGLTYITDLLREVVLFAPRVVVALLVLAFGAYFAQFLGAAVATYCHNVGIQDADFLGKVGQYAILVFVILIALDQMNVGGDIVRQSFLIVLAGLVFALALAFGLGARERAAELLDRWWPRGPNRGDS